MVGVAPHGSKILSSTACVVIYRFCTVLFITVLLLQVSLEALWWVVLHNLTPLNYVLALEASIWFIERAAMEHPKQKVGLVYVSSLVHRH